MVSRGLARFNEHFMNAMVSKAAEKIFKDKVREFCTNFTPRHVELAAKSGRPISDLLKLSPLGAGMKPTPEHELNAGQRYLVNLPNDRLLALVKEAVSPQHAVMLDRYPQVAEGIIHMVKGMVLRQQ